MMLQLQRKLYSFTDYLNDQDNSNDKCELVNGELIIMLPASGNHALILRFLFKIIEIYIETQNLNYFVMPGNVGVRTAFNKSRIPDLLIVSSEQIQELKEMKTAVLESPPLLAIEIVSSGNKEDDYRYKRSEYAAIEIPEYWIVDPLEEKISILSLVSGFYEVVEFKKNDNLISQLFSKLNIKVNDILNQ